MWKERKDFDGKISFDECNCVLMLCVEIHTILNFFSDYCKSDIDIAMDYGICFV